MTLCYRNINSLKIVFNALSIKFKWLSGEFLLVRGKHILLVPFLTLCSQINFLLRMSSSVIKPEILESSDVMLNQNWFVFSETQLSLEDMTDTE